MPTPGADSPIQRVPSGLFGPGGIGFCPCAHGEAGGYHHGFRHFVTTVNRPSGVGYLVCPVATGNARQNRIPLYANRRFDPRRMTITAPKLPPVTFGFKTFGCKTTGPRRFALSSTTT